MCELVIWDCSAIIPVSSELTFFNKGTDSVVYLLSNFIVKVSRTDRMRPVNREADILRIIHWKSKNKIVPRVLANTRYCLLMERVTGETLKKIAENSTPFELKKKIINLLIAARELDSMGIAHRELARPGEHVIFVGEKPLFLDFGSATLTEKANNLTQIFSQVFLSYSEVSITIRKKLGISEDNKQRFVELLRLYKKEKDGKNSSRERIFDEILEKIEKEL